MKENVDLIREINDLKREKKILKDEIKLRKTEVLFYYFSYLYKYNIIQIFKFIRNLISLIKISLIYIFIQLD